MVDKKYNIKRHILLSTSIRDIKYYRVLNLIFLFTLFINEAKSQYAIAGAKGAIYVDIIPDTLLNPLSGETQNYYIDINQNGNNDLKIRAYAHTSSGGISYSINVSSLDSNLSFSFWRIDSTDITDTPYCSGWVANTILKIYNNGDTIKNGNYVSSGFLASLVSYGLCSTGASSPEWINKGDVFLGVKYQTASDTSYGWVKVNVTGFQKILIEEFSLGSPLSGINSLDINSFIKVYPNPASTIMNFALQIPNEIQSRNIELQVTNVMGEEVKNVRLSGRNNLQIDVSDLREGIYFVQVKTREGILTKKIVVQR